MCKLSGGILVIFLMASLSMSAQQSFVEVDSVSYALYQSASWDELATFGLNAAENGFDYYYLNVRTGRAYFELGNYKQAQVYFSRALANNSTSLFAKEYLFWSHYAIGEEPEAAKFYALLPDSIQSRIDFESKKPLDFIYLEGGIKFSGDSESAKNMYYGRFALLHKFSPRFELYQNYVFMEQQLIWGKMHQHQYILTPVVNLNKAWKIAATFNYSNYKSHLNFNDQYTWQNSTSLMTDSGHYVIDTNAQQNYLFKGDYIQNSLMTQLNLNKRVGNWSLTPHASMYMEWVNPDYYKTVNSNYAIKVSKQLAPPPSFLTGQRYDSTNFNVKSSYSTWQFGLDLNYTFAKRYTLGADINYVRYSGLGKWNLSPYFRAAFTDKFAVSAYFVSKKNYLLSLFGGSQFLNSYDALKVKLSLTAEFALSKRFQLFTTYQYDSVEDNLSLRTYQLNSAFLGLKIKL